jgi:hypothetical protein
MLAKHLRKGMQIEVDCGYGTPMMEFVKIIEIENRLSMFGDFILNVRIERYSGERFDVAFTPNEEVDLK